MERYRVVITLEKIFEDESLNVLRVWRGPYGGSIPSKALFETAVEATFAVREGRRVVEVSGESK